MSLGRHNTCGHPGLSTLATLDLSTLGSPNGIALKHAGVEITETDATRDARTTPRLPGASAPRRTGRDRRFRDRLLDTIVAEALPVDVVKIDQGFVTGVLHDPRDQSIAEAVISMAKSFGFDALGEGVETPEQIGRLRERSCRYAQGFGICLPLRRDAFKEWLERRK